MSDKKQLSDKCAVTRDLMPLCIDGTASEASQRRVKKHVVDCPPCATVFQEMQTQIDLDVPVEQETEQFDSAVKKVKHKHAWRKLRNVLLGIVMALVVCAGLAYGYYWYFVEEVPLSIDLYEMELVLRSPQRAQTPVLIKTDNMPKPATVHVEVRYDGSVMDVNGMLKPNWVMYVWASTTRSVDLEKCGYEDRTYYAFDLTEAEAVFAIDGALYRTDAIYNGAPDMEGRLLYKAGMEDYKLKWSARNNVLRSVASLEIIGGEKVSMPFVTPVPTVSPVPTTTPRANGGLQLAATSTPAVVMTPVPSDLLLYYNTLDQAVFYHVDPMCSSMDFAYLPLDGKVQYGELNDDFYISLQACPHCGAPQRNWGN